MSKIAIVYWSGTGNTEQMANFVAAGVQSAGAEAELLDCSKLTAETIDTYDAVAFGCPSMGDEVLEESEFQPMFDAVKSKLSGKKIALFGSYGWGDGEWMRNWSEECSTLGAVQVCEFVIANEAPDGEAEEACKAMGAALST